MSSKLRLLSHLNAASTSRRRNWTVKITDLHLVFHAERVNIGLSDLGEQGSPVLTPAGREKIKGGQSKVTSPS